MPHYGLMDSTTMTEEDAALLQARLHLRGGKRKLQEGQSVAGIVALYDALLFGMHFFVAGPGHSSEMDLTNNETLWNCAALYHALTQAGVFDDPFEFNDLSLTVERALWDQSFSFDAAAILAKVETMLTRLGVMPFDESRLPLELETHMGF